MKKRLPARRVSVCVLSTHPMVLAEFQRLMARSGFDLHTRQLVTVSLSELKEMRVPRAQVYLVDVPAPIEAGERLAAAILSRRPRAAVLVLAERFDDANAFPLLRLGVKGLLRYDAAELQLPRAVKQVASGGYWVSRPLLHRFTDSVLRASRRGRRLSAPSRISGREQEVLQGLLDNHSNKEIASKLNISERTVKFHVSNLLSKFGVQRRADLILLQFQNLSQR